MFGIAGARSKSACRKRAGGAGSARGRARWLAAPFLVVLAVAVFAPASAWASDTMTGTVVDSVSSSGVSGVTVTARDVTTPANPAVGAVTGASGQYTLSGLANGDHYYLEFSSSSYSPQYSDGTGADDSTPDPSKAGYDFAASSGGTIDQIEIVAGGGINGIVTDNVGGAVITNDVVDITTPAGAGLEGEGEITQADVDSNGDYYVDGLPGASDYLVEFVPSQGSEQSLYYPGTYGPGAATLVSVTAGSNTTGINQTLAANSVTINASITAPSGHTLGEPEILLYSDSGTLIDEESHATTTFTLPPGTYYVEGEDTTAADHIGAEYYGGSTTLTGATAITLGAGQSLAAAIALPAAAGAITGTVSGPTGANLADTLVFAVPAQDMALFGTDGDELLFEGESVPVALIAEEDGGSIAVVQPNGSYTLSNIAAGSYYVGVISEGGAGYASGWYAAAGPVPAWEESAPIGVGDTGTTPNINFALPQGGSIAGSVTQATNGAPVGSVLVEVYDAAGNPVTGAVTDNSDGTYLVGGLLPGTYYVEFDTAPALSEYDTLVALEEGGAFFSGLRNLGVQYYKNSATLAGATPVTVAGGSNTRGVDGVLTAAGEIGGTVTSATNGTGLPGVTVDVLDSKGDVVESTTTGAGGAYEVGALSAGTFYVEFDGTTTGQGGYVAQYYGDKATLKGSAGVAVTGGAESSGINAALVPFSAIGVPTESKGSLKGLSKRAVSLKFKVTAGVYGAPDLASFKVTLPKGFSFVKKKLAKDLSLGKGVRFVYTLKGLSLTISVVKPEPAFIVSIKAGGITDTKKLAKKAKKRKVKSETIKLSVTDTAGTATPLSFLVKKPR